MDNSGTPSMMIVAYIGQNQVFMYKSFYVFYKTAPFVRKPLDDSFCTFID